MHGKLRASFFAVLVIFSRGFAQQTTISDPFQTVVRNVFPELQGRVEELPHKCGTSMFVFAAMQWRQLSELAKNEIRASFQRPDKHKSRLSPSARFRIHYDTTGFAAPALLNAFNQPIPNSHEAYADSAATYLDLAWTTIIDSLGFAAPPADGTEGGGPEYDVYLDELGAGLSGFTAWDPGKPLSDGANKRYAAYSVLDNDFLFVRTKGMDGLKITAAHEFFHGVQVGSYGVWTTIPNGDFYFYEISSVWMEDVIHTNVNDYFFDLPAYFQNFVDFQGHNLAFTTYTPLYPGYERSIWAHFLTKKFGRNTIRQAWEAMRTEPFLKSMDRVLSNYGTSLAEEFATFSQWNFFTGSRADTVRYYPEGKQYPLLKPNAVQRYDGFSTVSIRFGSYPLSSQVYVFVNAADSVFSFVTNVSVALAQQYESATSPFELRLSKSTTSVPYQNLSNGLKVGFTAATIEDWRTSNLLTSTRADAKETGEPFPNPVRLSEVTRITLPVTTVAQDADVYFFSTSLDLLYSGRYQVIESLGKRYVYVPTRDFGSRVSSGVCFVVVQCPDAEYRWKVVLLH